MAGRNPGMVIVVAADIAEAKAAFKEVAEATGQVQTAAKETTTGMIAMGSAIGNIAADAAGALVKLGIDGVQWLGKQLWDVVDAALGVEEAFGAFKTELSEAIRVSGVMQTAFDTLGTALANAFGIDKQELIRRLTGYFNDALIILLDLSIGVVDFTSTVVSKFAEANVSIAQTNLAIGGIIEKILEANLTIAEFLAKWTPGDVFDKAAEASRVALAGLRGWEEQTKVNIAANEALARNATAAGTGIKQALTETRDAAIAANDAWKNAAASTTALADAGTDLVEGNAEVVLALDEQNRQMAAMDQWSRAIKDNDAFDVLTMNLTRTLPAFQATTSAAADTKAALEEVGTEAIDMSDDVRFAAEVVERAAMSWNDAMDAVRRGEGTMGGQVSGAKPANVSDAEWQQRLTDPAQWQLLHGFEWQSPNAGAWRNLPGFGANTAGNSQVNNITVNSVAGDKQAIAAVVKDALADDWRSTGLRG